MPENDETFNRVKKNFKTSKRSLSIESHYCLCKQSDRNGCKCCSKAGVARKRSLSCGDIKDDNDLNQLFSHFEQNNFAKEPTSEEKAGLKTCAIGQLKVWRFVCKSCKRGFSRKCIFNKHVFGNCRKGTFYYCEYCRKGFKKIDVARHASEHGLINCNICQKSLLSYFGLKRHLQEKHRRRVTVKSTTVLTTSSSLAQTHVKDVKKARKLNQNSLQIRNEISSTQKSTTTISNKNSTTTKVKKSKAKLPTKISVKTKDVKKSRKNRIETTTKVKNLRTKLPKKKSTSNEVKNSRIRLPKKNAKSSSNSTKSRSKHSNRNSVKAKNMTKSRSKDSNRNSVKAKNMTKSRPKHSSRNATNSVKQIEKLKTEDFSKKSVKTRNVSKVKESKTKNSMKNSVNKSIVKRDKKLTRGSNSNSTKTINLTKRAKNVNARDSNNLVKTRNVSKVKKPKTKDCTKKSVKMRNVPEKVKKRKTDFNMNIRKKSNVIATDRKLRKINPTSILYTSKITGKVLKELNRNSKRSPVKMGKSATSAKKLKTNSNKIM